MVRVASQAGHAQWPFVFLEGCLVGLLAWSIAYAFWEDRLVDRMVGVAVEEAEPATDEERAISIMNLVHAALKPRLDLLEQTGPVRPLLLNSTDAQLLVPAGHCGSFAHVLARALQRAGFEVRLAQMLSRGIWGDHVVVEAKVDGRWVVLDGYYCLAFRGADGELLGFKEIGRDWEDVRSQCPPGYKDHYRYEDVRYTNWRGLPVGVLGEWIGQFSVRTLFLNRYWTISVGLSVCLLGVFASHGWSIRRRRRHVTGLNDVSQDRDGAVFVDHA